MQKEMKVSGMRKQLGIIAFFSVFAALAGSGCGMQSENESDGILNVYDVVPYDVQFVLPDGWENTTDDSPYDLQMKNEDRYYCSIFGYKDIDLPNDMTPEDLFEFQKEDIFDKRDFVELVKEEPVWEDEYKKIYRELYSGELEGNKYYYYCCMIDFKEPSESLAWVIFSGTPSWIEHDLEDLNQILITSESVK